MEGLSSDAALLARCAVAALLGFLVGLERDRRGKTAGARTFALVAACAAAFTGIAIEKFAPGERIVQGIVQGIGFLGAGLIFRSEEGGVQGLTTAAAVWGVAAIGTMIGAGHYALGLGMGALVLGILELRNLRALLPQRRRK